MSSSLYPGLPLLLQYRDTNIEMIEKNRQHWYRVDGFDDLLPSVPRCSSASTSPAR